MSYESSGITCDREGYIRSLQTIEARAAGLRAGKPPQTYTELLLADQNQRVKKLASEVGELVREDCRPDFVADRFVGEAADTIYSVEVMTAARDLSFIRVLDTMGSELKAGRPTQAEATALASNKALLLRSLGAAGSGLVMQECRADFEERGFLIEAANVVYLTGVVLAGRGMTVAVAMNELARRNVGASV